ncbi:hypothetical protein ACLOJK_027683 [Asimina triloba]
MVACSFPPNCRFRFRVFSEVLGEGEYAATSRGTAITVQLSIQAAHRSNLIATTSATSLPQQICISNHMNRQTLSSSTCRQPVFLLARNG